MKKLLLSSLQLLEPKLEQKTGEKALKSGLFKSGDEIIPLSKGERFPPSTTNIWKIIVSV
jgi:hypothetical protein